MTAILRVEKRTGNLLFAGRNGFRGWHVLYGLQAALGLGNVPHQRTWEKYISDVSHASLEKSSQGATRLRKIYGIRSTAG